MKQNIQTSVDDLPVITAKQLFFKFIVRYFFVGVIVGILWGWSFFILFSETGMEISKTFTSIRNITTCIVVFFIIKKILWIYKITNSLGQTIIYDNKDKYILLDKSIKK